MNSQEQILEFMDSVHTIDDLYEALADSAGLGADEINKSGAGKSYFSRIWAQQCPAICRNNFVRAYIEDENTADGVDLITQLLTILVVVPGVNMVIVACLAVRIGLRSLCAQCST